MKQITLILSISLILLISIYIINTLQYKKIEGYQIGKSTLVQVNNDNILKSTNELSDVNNNRLGDYSTPSVSNSVSKQGNFEDNSIKDSEETDVLEVGNNLEIDEEDDVKKIYSGYNGYNNLEKKVDGEYNKVIRNKKLTKENLLFEKDRIIKLIKNLDVMKFFYTEGESGNLKIKNNYVGKKCKSHTLDLRGGAYGENSIKICANHCQKDKNCIAFNYFKGDDTRKSFCKLSSMCGLQQTDNDDMFDLYFKKNAVVPPTSDYILYPKRKCKNVKTPISVSNTSLSNCTKKCRNTSGCISFDYNNNTNKCRLYDNCYIDKEQQFHTDVSNVHNLYVDEKLKIIMNKRIVLIPCKKKFLIRLNMFAPTTSICINNNNKSGLMKCSKNKDNLDQIFKFSVEGYLQNVSGKYLYFEDNGDNGPSNGKAILGGRLPPNGNKLNFKWTFKDDGRIVSQSVNKITKKIYAINVKNIQLRVDKKDWRHPYSFNLNTVNKQSLELKPYNARSSHRWKRVFIN
jgi:hypothetical protein